MPQVDWLASVQGRYQLVLAVRASGTHGILALFEELDTQFAEIISERHVSSILHAASFVPWLAHDGSARRRSWQCHAAPLSPEIDMTDRKLLDQIVTSPLASLRELGKRCNLPASTVAYRFEKLLRCGVIIGFTLVYDDREAGAEGFVLSISTYGLAGTQYDALIARAGRNPAALWVVRMLGEWDLEIGVSISDVEKLNSLMRDVYMVGQGRVRQVAVHSVGTTYK